jgi:hypothetical protein
LPFLQGQNLVYFLIQISKTVDTIYLPNTITTIDLLLRRTLLRSIILIIKVTKFPAGINQSLSKALSTDPSCVWMTSKKFAGCKTQIMRDSKPVMTLT